MASKLGNGEGTIRKRSDGRWEARLVLEDGARKSVYGKTRQDVSRVLAQMRHDREVGLSAHIERQTVAQYLGAWLEKVTHEIEPSSYVRYGRVIRCHLLDAFVHVQLSKVTAQHIQALYARKLDAGISASGVRYMHVILHAALDDAVRLGTLQRNVSDFVNVPRLRRREIKPLTEAQARTLLAAAQGNRFEALYVLALATGMRRGELLALRWGMSSWRIPQSR